MAGKQKTGQKGRLKIGDDWNAITIIALSQNNPLKAVAEFVENSIDAGARNITIVRGKESGEHYLRITDDGRGIPRNAEGLPDFHYVATHICDSIKRQLKRENRQGIQGEFGIGLLSFWTVGEEMTLTSTGADGRAYQMRMRKGDPSYQLTQKHALFHAAGTELIIRPLLSGIRTLSGEKIQWYLASELRDRIRHSGARVEVIDRPARKQYLVEPRQFEGRLLHDLPAVRCALGDVYVELYLSPGEPARQVGLYRSGTRVLPDLAALDPFHHEPWTSGYLEGIVDAPFLNLTPGTRDGVIYDDAYSALVTALGGLEDALRAAIEEQRRAEEERASRHVLKSVQKALREALLGLPAEEYDWFDIHSGRARPDRPGGSAQEENERGELADQPAVPTLVQRQFFEFAGPLYSVRITPSSCQLPVNGERAFRAVPRDQKRCAVEEGVQFSWRILDGPGALDKDDGEIVAYHAGPEPGLCRLEVTARQGEIACVGEALITVTDSLLPEAGPGADTRQGLPGYTYRRAAGELWRSRFDAEKNLIVINNGHRDFVFASRNKALQLRYICRLFSKELVLKNFGGYPPEQLLERMLELTLHTEEHLK
ncbi:MAG TPA: ATP-binding protein [Kiritimatiellia bacterium]|nr:ATP-binding protein [Kiritimatiellia bacterium]